MPNNLQNYSNSPDNVFDKPARGPLEVLEMPSNGVHPNGGTAPSSLTMIFPENLGIELEHWVCFRVAREHQFRENVQKKENTQCYIYLPVPQQLQTGYNAGYSQTDLGALGAFTSEELQSATIGDKVKASLVGLGVGAAEEVIGGGLGALGSKVAGGSGAVGGIIGAVTGQGPVGSAVSQALGTFGVAINPHKAMLFQGVDFRTHQFSYNFIPRNLSESQKLVAIVGLFKYFMSPDAGKPGAGAAFLTYPEQFDIDFHYGETLFDISQSVLTSFTVDYHGQGTPTYFNDLNTGKKYPTTVNINMSFTEVTAMTKQQIRKLNR